MEKEINKTGKEVKKKKGKPSATWKSFRTDLLLPLLMFLTVKRETFELRR